MKRQTTEHGHGKHALKTHGGKDPHAHETHHRMNKMHGTPGGFGPAEDANDEGGCEADDSEDHRGSMTDSY